MPTLNRTIIRGLSAKAFREAVNAERKLEFWRSFQRDLEAAERVLNSLDRLSYSQDKRSGDEISNIRNPFKTGTVAAFIWEVLDWSPDPWLSTDDIQRLASDLKGEEISRNSIACSLSYQKDRTILRSGRKVALMTRVPHEITNPKIAPKEPLIRQLQIALIDEELT